MVLPEGLLFLVHFRHDGLFRRIVVRVHIGHCLRQLKILLIHFSFSQSRSEKLGGNCGEYVMFLDDAYDRTNLTERSLVAY